MRVDWLFGPVALEHGWAPAPRYLMRRDRILRLARDVPPGDLLEVGCGAGMLLHEFAVRGFRCTAVETSSPARRLARILAQEAGLAIQIRAAPSARWRRSFDTVLAFEVLEHIADDRGALKRWREWLRPGGRLLLSVPAHPERWGPGDEWAGHHRRYERNDLVRRVREAGFEVERVECYGYPFANVGERIAGRTYAARTRRPRGGANDRRANDVRSGIDRGPHVALYPFLTSYPGRLAIAACLLVQALFLATDLGSGYVLRARRP